MKIFKIGEVEDDPSLPDLIGGKGSSLVRMTKLGLNVPPAFCLPTSGCFLDYSKDDLVQELREAISEGLEYISGKLPEGRPLLLSVRSGAKISMPGMMDTILNVGANRDSLPGLSKYLGEQAAYDCYRRFLAMFGNLALGIDQGVFKHPGVTTSGNPLEEIKELAYLDERAYLDNGMDLPSNVIPSILLASALTIYRSWNNPRAVEYRKLNSIPDDLGTAVTIQAMVFGNLDEKSGTGVVFSRDPSTGDDVLCGEYLSLAQGEDVVSGVRTPQPISSLKDSLPEVYASLSSGVKLLEEDSQDMQDVEFTVEGGTLFFLQSRVGKRTPKAAVKIASDLFFSGVIGLDQLSTRISRDLALKATLPVLPNSFSMSKPTYTGIAAGGGPVSGVVVKSVSSALSSKEPCILVTTDTNPDDLPGLVASQGIVTLNGGLTSHAAVVARELGKSCVVGLGASSGVTDLSWAKEGDPITIDGGTGKVWVGKKAEIQPGGVSLDVAKLISGAMPEGKCLRIADLLDCSVPVDTLWVDAHNPVTMSLTDQLLSPYETIIVSFMESGHVSPESEFYLGVLGLKGVQHKDTALFKHLCNLGGGVRDKIWMIFPADAPDGLINLYSARGFKVIKSPTLVDIACLKNGDILALPQGDGGEPEAVEYLVSLVEKECHIKVSRMPKPCHWFNLFD